MRRTDREVRELSRVLSIIQSCDCCRLGFAERGEAYIVPLNFGYELQNGRLILYFHSASEGRKIDLLQTHAALTFEMDTGHSLTEASVACGFSCRYRCVMGRGDVALLYDEDEKRYAMNRIMAHYSDRDDWDIPPEALRAVTAWKLSVTSFSCKEHV